MTRRLLLAALAGTSLLAAPAPPALAGPSLQLAADARSAGRDAVRRDGALRPGGRLPLDLADDGTTWGAATKVYDGHPCTNETEPVLGPLAGEYRTARRRSARPCACGRRPCAARRSVCAPAPSSRSSTGRSPKKSLYVTFNVCA